MEQKTILIIRLIVLLAFCSGAKAISCYSCGSIYDADCGDPFVDGEVEHDCESCSKKKGEDHGKKVLFRECETKTGNTEGCVHKTANNQSADICTCMTELCNASSRVSMSTVMFILLPVFASFFLNIF